MLASFLVFGWNVQNITAQTASIAGEAINFVEEQESEALEFLRFNAASAPDAIELFWENSFETNLLGYEIQRSVDGTDFEKIKWVETIGDEDHGGAYLHLDESPFSNQTVYYRIKSITRDGRYQLSEVKIVDLQYLLSTIEMLPNTTVEPNLLTIEKSMLDSTQPVKVLDSEGKVVLQSAMSEQGIQFDFTALNVGTYFVQVPTIEGELKVERILKQ